MGTYTTNLNLYNTNMLTDGNDTFDFQRDLNDNNNKIDSAIGKLANLTTTTKDNLVNAINEVKSGNFANQNLSNLSSTGEARLHALKGYLDEGEVLTDAEGLADVINGRYSTFDLSKFTVVGSPTISDGVVSNFSTSNYLTKSSAVTISNTGEFHIDFNFKSSSSANIQYCFDLYSSSAEILVRRNSYNPNTYSIICFPNSSGAEFNEMIEDTSNDITGFVEYKNGTYICELNGTRKTKTSDVKMTAGSYNLALGARLKNGTPQEVLTTGSVDLKRFKISIDGIEAFSGNQTGTDTYTIGGNTVTIPYTLSKTGSKIVDSSYRTALTTIYNAQGIAPYYSLDEVSGNYTLPMGEVYGMMLNRSTPHIVKTYVNGAFGYNEYSNGRCEQWGKGIADNNGFLIVNLMKNYRDINYNPIANQCYGDTVMTLANYADIVSTDSMTTSSFRILCSTNADTPANGCPVAWRTTGYLY